MRFCRSGLDLSLLRSGSDRVRGMEGRRSSGDVLVISLGDEASFPFALIADALSEANRAGGDEKILWDSIFWASDGEKLREYQAYRVVIFLSSDTFVPDLKHAQRELFRRVCRSAHVVSATGGAIGILAHLRLLDGRRAAAPLALRSALIETYPQIEFQDAMLQKDGRYWTCAGGVRTAELILAIIEELSDQRLRESVSARLLLGGGNGKSCSGAVSISGRYGFRNEALSRAIALMQENIEQSINATDLAEGVGLSRRQLERLFQRYLRTSPGKFLMESRLARARQLLLYSNMPVSEVGQAVGIPGHSQLARCVRKHFGTKPLKVRELAGRL